MKEDYVYQMLITVNKEELLKRMEANKSRHRQVFEAALQGFRKEALRQLEERIQDITHGKIRDIGVRLPVPEDHTRDYERVIGMLKMDTNPEFKLDEQTYAQYVDDDWAWKRQFLNTSNVYAAATVDMVYPGENNAS